MAKFLILLLLMSSGLQIGQFEQLSIVDIIIKTIGQFNTVSTGRTNMAKVFNDIVGLPDQTTQIQHSINALNDKLTYMNNFITDKLQDIQNEIRSLEAKEEVQRLEREFSRHIQTVTFAAREISETSRQLGGVSDSRLQTLVTHHYNGLLVSVDQIQQELAPSDGRGQAKSLAEWYARLTADNLLHRCGTGTSPQQLLLGLYVDIIKTEAQAMEALSFLTSLQQPEEHVWETLTKRFVWRYNAYVESFKNAFATAVREHRSCDPDAKVGWKRGVTFFELERYNQATTFHRTGSLPRRAKWPSCSDWFQRVLAKQKFPEAACGSAISEACWRTPNEICKGTLHDCLAPTDITTCINDWQGSPRRYAWIKNVADEVSYGNTDIECSDRRAVNKGYGDTCVCHCVEGHNKISLDLSLSDIGTNRVITAIQFAQKDNIIFIQIKQGTLQPDGRITDESTSWEPSSPSTASDKLFVYNVPGQGINLDDLLGGDDEVLTGIGFAKSDGAPKKRVKIQIRVTKFNYTAGTLGEQSRFISETDKYRLREPLENGNPVPYLQENIPTTAAIQAVKKYITFERSSLTEDAGQTTLPLFDAVPVYGLPPSPLGGAGLMHKKSFNYGGFLSLRAIGINIAKYFTESVKPIPNSVLTTQRESFKNLIEDLLSAV